MVVLEVSPLRFSSLFMTLGDDIAQVSLPGARGNELHTGSRAFFSGVDDGKVSPTKFQAQKVKMMGLNKNISYDYKMDLFRAYGR